ncbi:Septum_form domain-containing protein [Frankia sp. Hr75.2]|uniref:septum formation family protein n=1 Tax=Parafrankia soli TaxID=2599596 RepID=UPI0009F41C18|nr:septum formation family protein [Parafrankia soli]CAI7978424.1 Septum_form domain-containing protein [Frankia sp. Hr75.2]
MPGSNNRNRFTSVGNRAARLSRRLLRLRQLRAAEWRDHLTTIAINAVLLGAVIYGLVALHGDRAADRGSDAAEQTAPATIDPIGPSTTASPSADAGVEFLQQDYQPGRCYSWQQHVDSTSTQDVPCAGVHYFEAVGDTRIRPDHPSDGAYPTPEEWDAVTDKHCLPMIEKYLGGPLDPAGRFSAGLIRPQKPGWEIGQRTITCGITAGMTEFDPPAFRPFEGSARGADQSMTHTAGSCFRRAGDDGLVEAPCELPHHAQSVGAVSAPETPDGAAPSDTWLNEKLGPRCGDLAAPYLEIGRFDGALVEPQWNLIAPESWRAGSRRTTCFIGFADEAGSPMTVTGVMTTPVV